MFVQSLFAVSSVVTEALMLVLSAFLMLAQVQQANSRCCELASLLSLLSDQSEFSSLVGGGLNFLLGHMTSWHPLISRVVGRHISQWLARFETGLVSSQARVQFMKCILLYSSHIALEPELHLKLVIHLCQTPEQGGGGGGNMVF